MTMTKEKKREFSNRDRWLALAFVLGPSAALGNLEVSYSLVQTACAHGSKAMLHVTALGFVMVSLFAALIGWRGYTETAESDGLLLTDRTRWVSIVVAILAISSAVVIIAMEIPNVILGSCD